MNENNKFHLTYKTASYLHDKANFFKNSLPKLLVEGYDFELAERICQIGFQASDNEPEKYFKNLNGLIDLSIDFLKLQVKLEKEGKYVYTSFEEVKKMYDRDENKGPNYLWGLYFSEVFWKIHCNLTKFFVEEFVKNTENNGTVLEIPIGTGYYFCEFLREKTYWNGVGMDIASNAVLFANKICNLNNIDSTRFKIIQQDFTTYTKNEKFERIICGEFLEHVENPEKILVQLSNLLTNNGKIFLTAAIWSGGIDHIFLYENPEQVRQHIRKAGLKIEKELIQAVFEKDQDNPEKGKIPVNFAVILSKNS